MSLNTTTILQNGFAIAFKTIFLLNDYQLSTGCFCRCGILRQELLEVIEQRLDETEIITWAELDTQFHFVSSQIIVFDTRERIEDRRNW